MSSRTLWLSVWDWDIFGRNRFLGEVRLPLSSLDLSVSKNYWYSLLDKVKLLILTSSTPPSSLSSLSVSLLVAVFPPLPTFICMSPYLSVWDCIPQ